jgi:Ni/Co efflux regulator RcnB
MKRILTTLLLVFSLSGVIVAAEPDSSASRTAAKNSVAGYTAHSSLLQRRTRTRRRWRRGWNRRTTRVHWNRGRRVGRRWDRRSNRRWNRRWNRGRGRRVGHGHQM